MTLKTEEPGAIDAELPEISGQPSEPADLPSTSIDLNSETHSEPRGFREVPPIYRAIMVAIDRQRVRLGLNVEELTELAGLADRCFSKHLWPQSSSGRCATHMSLQALCDVLWPTGFRVEIRADAPMDEARQLAKIAAMRPLGRKVRKRRRAP